MFPRFKETCDRAQILLIRCQVMASDVDERINELQAVVLQHRDKFIRDLVEVEGWLAQVYNLLCQEPARGLGDYAGNEQQSASSEEGEGEEEPDKEDPSYDDMISDDSQGSLGLETSADYSLGSPVDVAPNGAPLDSSVDGPSHETSVNMDLDDDQFSQEVLQRVISPEGEREDENEAIPGFQSLDSSQLASSVDLPAPSYPRGVLREGEETESVSSESTLRADTQEPTAESKTELGKEEEGEGVSTTVPESHEEGRTLAEELGELGLQLSPSPDSGGGE